MIYARLRWILWQAGIPRWSSANDNRASGAGSGRVMAAVVMVVAVVVVVVGGGGTAKE